LISYRTVFTQCCDCGDCGGLLFQNVGKLIGGGHKRFEGKVVIQEHTLYMVRTGRLLILNGANSFWSTAFAALVVMCSIVGFAHAATRVAVFSQSSFPTYNQAQLVSPSRIATVLKGSGVSVDLLNAEQLSDSSVLNISNYAVVILPYGNTYPSTAFENLRRFHQSGGSLVLSGIPFTHAVTQAPDGTWDDQGNDNDPALYGPDGIGVGGYHDGTWGSVVVSPADPLQLKSIGVNWGNGEDVQAIDPAGIPPVDDLVPITIAGSQPVAAVIIHHDEQFPGAIDVWTNNRTVGDEELAAYGSEQLMERGAITALRLKRLVTLSQAEHSFTVIGKELPSYVTLPSVPRPYPTLQPKMHVPATHLLVVDVRQTPKDELLMLASLQGIVNRSEPRIYLITSDDDQFWLDQMIAEGDTGTPQIVTDPISLFATFRSEINGVVIPDPNCYVSPDIAVDIAGIDNDVIGTPSLAQLTGLPVKADLRGRFHSDSDALRFVRTNLLSKSNRYIALCLDPPLLGAQIDDIVAARGTCFWVTGPKEQDRPGADMVAEKQEIEKTFADMPLGAVIRGFWWHGDGMGLDETPGVSLGSEYGKITTVSDYVANYSVTSGIPLKFLKQRPTLPSPQLDRNKVYFALTLSDGDNLCTWRHYFRDYFTSPLYGTFPLAFGMGPSLLDVAPEQAEWYYEHAAPNTEFICDVSGAGYIYPTLWAADLTDPKSKLDDYYQWTSKYMARMDMHTLRLMNVGTSDIANAGSLLPQVDFLMPDYGLSGENSYPQYTYTLPTGQSVFRAATDGPGAEKLANEIRQHSGSTRPAFLNAFIWNWGSKMSDLKQMIDLLGPEYVAVTPSQLDNLYRESKMPEAPATTLRQ
jgi:hypothetical protein